MGKIKRVHVNQHNLRKNIKRKEEGLPPLASITVKCGKYNIYGHECVLLGESTVRYPDKPLGCGARVWVETKGPVEIHDWDTGKMVFLD